MRQPKHHADAILYRPRVPYQHAGHPARGAPRGIRSVRARVHSSRIGPGPVTICSVTAVRCCSSALTFGPCGKCRFISSPSVSCGNDAAPMGALPHACNPPVMLQSDRTWCHRVSRNDGHRAWLRNSNWGQSECAYPACSPAPGLVCVRGVSSLRVPTPSCATVHETPVPVLRRH